MPGPTPSPTDQRRRRNVPSKGEWQHAPGTGWQHGTYPKPPSKMLKATKDAWAIWFGAWYAAFWTPDDVPALRQLARLYDEVERGETQRHAEMRIAMDTWGITPKGQQDRRWLPPATAAGDVPEATEPSGQYGHLRPVADAG